MHLVVDLAPPDDHVQEATGDQGLADLPQGRDRVGEEHRAHARERVVEGPVEVGGLDVGRLEARRCRGRRRRPRRSRSRSSARRRPPRGRVRPARRARRCEPSCRRGRSRCRGRGRRFAAGSAASARSLCSSRPIGHDVAVLDPDVEERPVPGLRRLDVVFDYPGSVPHMHREGTSRGVPRGARGGRPAGPRARRDRPRRPAAVRRAPRCRPRSTPRGLDAQPAGFELDVHDALRLSNRNTGGRGVLRTVARGGRRLDVTVATRGDGHAGRSATGATARSRRS